MPRSEGVLSVLLLVLCAACAQGPGEVPLEVPRGYMQRLQVRHDGQLYGFGPFVGYYFRPPDPGELSRLRFVCFNEQGFYASDAPRNALLFEGDAVLAELPAGEAALAGEPGDRIRPVFDPDLPQTWRATRPDPADQYRHFHSCYDANGPARVGYWLRHAGKGTFTYDMGARVSAGSPLYHRVRPGADLEFASSVEFDRGPGRSP
ncbi:MAG TPA: hypothetical protein VK997_02970 [Deferrisomatales bacterium]|nr:hypothetical protein [Deferrisomatales bacterium]